MSPVSWFLGVAGIIASFIIYQQKERKKLLIAKVTNDLIWTLHYASFSAWSGAVVCLLGTLRDIVFLVDSRKEKPDKKVLIVFLVLSIVCTAATWKNIFSIFPGIVAILAVYSFWQSDPKLSKLLCYPIGICMMIYDLIFHSYTGLVNDTFIIVSSSISLYQLSHSKKAESEGTEAQHHSS